MSRVSEDLVTLQTRLLLTPLLQSFLHRPLDLTGERLGFPLMPSSIPRWLDFLPAWTRFVLCATLSPHPVVMIPTGGWGWGWGSSVTKGHSPHPSKVNFQLNDKTVSIKCSAWVKPTNNARKVNIPHDLQLDCKKSRVTRRQKKGRSCC